MKPRLDQYFCEQYPGLYRDRHADVTKSPMAWGFDVGDGWFCILDELSAALVALPEEVVAVQVKEKFGMLRFYIQTGSGEAYALIQEAERRSGVTCETCGRPGQIRGEVWLSTRCDKHAEDRK